ncbi:MAG: glycosyltransferase family 87 protein [Hyphomonadaceae bacterium]|nr:glycosyltransferase family 87 protein [Hyphomonadaceae bacterium]
MRAPGPARFVDLGAFVRRSPPFWSGLRDAAWLDGRRARAYLLILAAVTALMALGYVVTARGGLDALGKPLGTDFSSPWSAARLALAGAPVDAWNPAVHWVVQRAQFGADVAYTAFVYPPPFLLLNLPLGALPYLPALVVWLLATGAAWAVMARAWVGGALSGRAAWLALLAFPAVMVNAGHGQNGFLTAALLGAAAFLHERRPWFAGALVGLLVIKPHLALLAPLFFVFTGNWRAFAAAGVSAVGLCVLSVAALGVGVWEGFLDSLALSRGALDHNLVGYAKMQSAFAGVKLLGGPAWLAWAVQVAFAGLAIAALWTTRNARLGAGAAFACAALVATPYVFDYDMALLVAPLAWLFAHGVRGGFLPWERIVLLTGFALPLVSRPLAMATDVPIAPLAMLALLACVVRRARMVPAGACDGQVNGAARHAPSPHPS